MTASLNKLLLENIHTKEDLDSLVSEISQLLASLYKTEKTFDMILESGISATTAGFIERNLKKKDHATLIAGLTDLSKLLQQIRTIHLTFGFEPTHEAISNIHKWLLTNMKNIYVLEINYDPKILGGVVVEYEGRFGDYSLRKRVDLYMKENKSELLTRIKQL